MGQKYCFCQVVDILLGDHNFLSTLPPFICLIDFGIRSTESRNTSVHVNMKHNVSHFILLSSLCLFCDWGPPPPKVGKFVLIKKVVDSKLFPPNADARGGIS